MSQIFISHSQRDKTLVSLFSKVFGSTPVRHVCMELEKIIQGANVTPADVEKEIRNSAAMFILLSENVNNTPHTRDWIAWESGVAASSGKDIWVFEPTSDLGRINIVIPHFTHYIPIDTSLEQAYAYIHNIVKSYADSEVLPTAAAFGFLGAIGGTLLTPPEQRTDAALAGFLLGSFFGAAIQSGSDLRPMGTSIQCVHCNKPYYVHAPFEFTFRCPGCNTHLQLIKP